VTTDAVIVAARAAASKTSDPTIVLDVGDLLGITDAFVITSGANARQVRTIAEEVRRQVKDEMTLQLLEGGREFRCRVEGREDSGWLLLDYGDFVVHVFSVEARSHYALERLWADARRIEWAQDVCEGVGS